MAVEVLDRKEFFAQLSAAAEVDVSILSLARNIHMLFRSADSFLSQAQTYERERDLQSAYVLYLRYCNLVLEILPKHPKWKDGETKAEKDKVRAKTAEIMEKIEKMKVFVFEDYLQVVGKRIEEEEMRIKEEEEKEKERIRLMEKDNTSLLLPLAAATTAMSSLSINEPLRAIAPPLPSVDALETGVDSSVPSFTQSAHLLDSRSEDNPNLEPPLVPQSSSSAPLSSLLPSSLLPSSSLSSSSSSSTSSSVQPVPSLLASPPVVPSLPAAATTAAAAPATAQPPPYRSYRSDPSIKRAMELPRGLLARFLEIAHRNTVANVETCGLLTGDFHLYLHPIILLFFFLMIITIIHHLIISLISQEL
jgi:STAM-binding protein